MLPSGAAERPAPRTVPGSAHGGHWTYTCFWIKDQSISGVCGCRTCRSMPEEWGTHDWQLHKRALSQAASPAHSPLLPAEALEGRGAEDSQGAGGDGNAQGPSQDGGKPALGARGGGDQEGIPWGSPVDRRGPCPRCCAGGGHGRYRDKPHPQGDVLNLPGTPQQKTSPTGFHPNSCQSG